MRDDIGARLERYRLSRYAAPQNPWRYRVRWVLLGLAAWVLWAGIISEHSFYRLWRIKSEANQKRAQLESIEAEVNRLNYDLDDPKVRDYRAEQALRKQGMAAKDEYVYVFEENLPDSLRR